MPDRVRIIDAIERHVPNPQRSKAELIGESRERDLLVEVDCGLVIACDRQCDADRELVLRKHRIRDGRRGQSVFACGHDTHCVK
jgi:hypothetical protein